MLSRDDVEAMIANGDVIVVYRGSALRLNSWISKHPGGETIIRHMVGMDATLEMAMNHSEQTLARVKHFRIGKVEQPWRNLLPPIRGDSKHHTQQNVINQYVQLKEDELRQRQKLQYPDGDVTTQREIADKFEALYNRLLQEGYFQCHYYRYIPDLARVAFALAVSIHTLSLPGSVMVMVSALFLGIAWQHAAFIMHDGGHMAISHNYYIDTVIAFVVSNCFEGFSLGWWKWDHNIHHVVTNYPEHDPDIQQVPYFVLSVQNFGSLWSSFYGKRLSFDWITRKLVSMQRYLFYPLLLISRFKYYLLSWLYCVGAIGRRPTTAKAMVARSVEIAGLALFLYWYAYGILFQSIGNVRDRILHLFLAHATFGFFQVQLSLSHFAMSMTAMGMDESFPQRALRTTMDIACPPWLDFVHSGVQFQIIHHLFPRMPKHNFRRARKPVMEFCQQVGLPYPMYGFGDCNKRVLGRLHDISQQARILATCASTEADKLSF